MATCARRSANVMESGEDRTTAKKLATKLATKLQAEEERMKRLMDTAPDPGLTFEDMGVDYLFVDEAHDYKNMCTVKNIKGGEIAGSALPPTFTSNSNTSAPPTANAWPPWPPQPRSRTP